MSNKLRFGLPKGSLQDATIEKMAKAGFNVQVSSQRPTRPPKMQC